MTATKKRHGPLAALAAALAALAVLAALAAPALASTYTIPDDTEMGSFTNAAGHKCICYDDDVNYCIDTTAQEANVIIETAGKAATFVSYKGKTYPVTSFVDEDNKKLTSADLSDCTELKEIEVSNCKSLTTLKLPAKLPKLKQAIVRKTAVTSLSLKGLKRCKLVRVDDNAVTSLSVSGKVKALYVIEDKGPSTVDLRKCKGLRGALVWCYGAKTIKVGNQKYLKYLAAGGTKCKTVVLGKKCGTKAYKSFGETYLDKYQYDKWSSEYKNRVHYCFYAKKVKNLKACLSNIAKNAKNMRSKDGKAVVYLDKGLKHYKKTVKWCKKRGFRIHLYGHKYA